MVTVEGAGMLDLAVWRQADSMTVHLVNLTNPMMMKGPYRELVPSPPQVVRLRLPEGQRAGRVQLLVGGTVVDAEASDGYLEVRVPEILDREVVAVDLTP